MKYFLESDAWAAQSCQPGSLYKRTEPLFIRVGKKGLVYTVER